MLHIRIRLLLALIPLLMLVVPVGGPALAGESSTALHVSALTSEVVPATDVVRVTHDLRIANPLAGEREHVVDLRLPERAVIDRFGMWVQGRYLEGEIAPRALGRRLYREVSGIDDPTRIKRDPALLTWEGPGHARIRVFPVPASGEVRLLLSYVVVRPPGQDLVLPPLLAEGAIHGVDVRNDHHHLPATPLPAVLPYVRAYAGTDGAPGFFCAVLPLPTWNGQAQVPDLDLIVRDTSARMRGRYAPGSVLHRELMALATNGRRCFLMDADVVPQPVVPLTAQAIAQEPACDGLFDLARALAGASQFLDGRSAATMRISILGDGEPQDDRSRTGLVSLPTSADGQVTLSCAASPAWLRDVASALIDDRDLTAVEVTGIDGVDDLTPDWQARAPVAGHLVVFGRWRSPRGTVRLTARCPDGSRIVREHHLDFVPTADVVWLPRVWAAERLHDLAAIRSLDATQAAENERVQHELARSFQVLGPASSLVVLSNERDYRVNDLERAVRIAGWAEVPTSELEMERPQEAFIQRAGNRVSRFMPAMEPEPTAGVDLRALWDGQVFGLASRHRQERDIAYLFRSRDEGRWTVRSDPRLPLPVVGWASRTGPLIPIPPPPAAVAWWGGRVAPTEVVIDGVHWCWWRAGERAVLQRLDANGTPDWWVMIDADGIHTALPEWGVWWRHAEHNSALRTWLLSIAPSPTWLPLSWIARHYRIAVQTTGDQTAITCTPWAQPHESDWGARGFCWIHVAGDALPRWRYHVMDQDVHRVSFTQDGDAVTVTDEFGVDLRRPLRPFAGVAALPFSADMPTIGVLDAASLWGRVRGGTASAFDHWQLALVAAIDAEALPWLERAHVQAPEHPGIALHLAVVLHEAGHTARARTLLTASDARPLPDWQRAGFQHLRQCGDGILPPPADLIPPPERAKGPAHQAWPRPWERATPTTAELDDLRQRSTAAVVAVDPVEVARLARLRPWDGLSGLGRPQSEGDHRSTLQYLLGDVQYPPEWPVAAAKRLLTLLDQDALGQSIIARSLHEGGPVLVDHLVELLRDPQGYPLARSLLRLRDGRLRWQHLHEGWRQHLLALTSDTHPPAVRALANARLARDFPWHFRDAADAGATIHGHLSALVPLDPQVMADCLALEACLTGTAGGDWDALLAAWRASGNPATVVELERGLAAILRSAIRFHRVAELAALLPRLMRLTQDTGLVAVNGPLRPLVVQLCRQAAALGLRNEAATTAAHLLSVAPEPGLDEALRGADPRDLAQVPGDDGTLTLIDGQDGAPFSWWPEYREDATALARRAIGGGEGGMDERTWLAIHRRGMAEDVALAACGLFPAHALDLHTLAMETTRRPTTARRALDAVRALRPEIACPTFAGLAAARLAFITNQPEEAARELDALLAFTPRHPVLDDLRLLTSALTGDGSSAGVLAREWVTREDSSAHTGETYNCIVDLLTAVHRYTDALAFRQEALAYRQRELAAGSGDETAHAWTWLERLDRELFDEVAVAPSAALLPDSTAPQVAADTAAALGRFAEVARLAQEGFAIADAAQRFLWFDLLWQVHEQRYAAPCPPLHDWLVGLVRDRAPLPDAQVDEILVAVGAKEVATWLTYAGRCQMPASTSVRARLLWQANALVDRTQDAAGLLAIVTAEGQPLPRDRTWMWTAREPPPAFTTLLTQRAVEDAQRALDFPALPLSTEELTWIRTHDAVRRQVDAVVAARLAQHPDDVLLLARCAALGWGPPAMPTVWRRLAQDPRRLMCISPEDLGGRVRDLAVASLIEQSAWQDLLAVARLLPRAKLLSRVVSESVEKHGILQRILDEGHPELAHALAATIGNGTWLIAHGVPDPTTHPDWNGDEAWTLRADPARLLRRAQDCLADPFSDAFARERAHAWRFAVHWWRGEFATAVQALDDHFAADPHAQVPPWSRRVFQLDQTEDAADGFVSVWEEVRQRLSYDWFIVHAVTDATWDERTTAHVAQFDQRCRDYLAWCANAPEGEVTPLALLMLFSSEMTGAHNPAPAASIGAMLGDLTQVFHRCGRLGMGPMLGEWWRLRGVPWIGVVEPTPELWPVHATAWCTAAHLIGRAEWPAWNDQGWERAWHLLSVEQQRTILRQVSSLMLLPGVERWCDQIREWSVDLDAGPLVVDETDPRSLKAFMPDAFSVPTPKRWLAREAAGRSD